MAEVPIERRFAGQARLIRLLLWKTGDSTDLNVCFDAALNAGMISADDALFLREYLAIEETQRETGEFPDELDESVILRLQRCADKLNRADSA